MERLIGIACVVALVLTSSRAGAQDASIRVDVRQEGRPVSKYLTGACIEDVNHEIYGGLYSQMIFGESFQEPPVGSPAKGFAAFGGDWKLNDGEMLGGGGDGPKLVDSTVPPFADGEAGVEVYLSAADGAGGGVHNAGLIVRAGRSGVGADHFDGYEVSLDAGRKIVSLGRHQQNYALLKDTPYNVPVDKWVTLAVKMTGGVIEISVDGERVVRFEDPRPLAAGAVGLRQWHRSARYRNLWAKVGGKRTDLPFEAVPGAAPAVSGMWRPVVTGIATLAAAIERDRPFVGTQSQRLTLVGGAGEVGIENQGLNRQGLAFASGKPYEGYVWLRADKPAGAVACLESRDGTRTYARAKLAVVGNEWQRYDFALIPDASETAGRFSLRLTSPGSVVVGHAFLQPGPWGRFKGLPVRRDVVEGLIDQGVTVLRYGGSMVNAPEYRWKKMIGPRDRRQPYHGTWYPQSSNGWGIIDFLDVCEAAGFLAVPDFNIDESPQDMADFIEYVNGPPDSPWGKRRAADGHPAPYKLRHVQLGNEEKVDEAYFQKFERLTAAIWTKDPAVVPVVGDFQYERPITDPMKVTGADSGVTSLAAHKKILDLTRRSGREVWFDVHMWTDGSGRSPSYQAFRSYVDAIDKLADGAKHRVAVFEFNSNNHDQRRALANADAIGLMIRDGRVPVALAANCLQPDGQNDNGWNQGLLFLNPSAVWLQPPGYVTRMVARNYLPRVIDARVEGADEKLSVTVTRSEDGKRVVLQVVNLDAKPKPARIQFDGFTPSQPAAKVEELAGPLDARNTAASPDRIRPRQVEWPHRLAEGVASYTFPPHSFTVIRFE
ncbi:family 16 glycoside hydrolase [Fimbriiglobus ruber]|uniref:non-reducing end alpha-L-arabinofuranosidase n=1 Tax=Fimbriiglobus ruber TaxID=1908690 RepID=A0A225D4Z8_9BACT|nr:family 16 glycoside hydrolase [Fimbriiglobus ruber]OWK36562.1 Alpha-N-arabinofuranosidase [Fimbriiglobus ruber]